MRPSAIAVCSEPKQDGWDVGKGTCQDRFGCLLRMDSPQPQGGQHESSESGRITEFGFKKVRFRPKGRMGGLGTALVWLS